MSSAGTILIAEDDVHTRRFLDALLTQEGYSVVAYENGQDTIDAVSNQQPDLILLDIMLPDMEGFEVCQRLRDVSQLADVPIVFLTARSDPHDKARGFDVGCTDYVTKPLEKVELLARIRAHLCDARTRRVMRRQANMLGEIVDTQVDRLQEVRQGQAKLMARIEDYPEIKLGVRFQPALEAGGDFYDIIRFSETDYGLVVADVSGHDLGTAYITGALKALVASFTSAALSTEETMMMLNTALNKFLDAGQYVTASYLKFSRKTGRLDVASAAHPEVLYQAANGECRYLGAAGDVLGMFETVSSTPERIEFQPGDRVFVFTDGITESYPDDQGRCGSRLHGMACFEKSVQAASGQPIQATIDEVIGELLSLRGGQVDDDLVLIGVEF